MQKKEKAASNSAKQSPRSPPTKRKATVGCNNSGSNNVWKNCNQFGELADSVDSKEEDESQANTPKSEKNMEIKTEPTDSKKGHNDDEPNEEGQGKYCLDKDAKTHREIFPTNNEIEEDLNKKEHATTPLSKDSNKDDIKNGDNADSIQNVKKPAAQQARNHSKIYEQVNYE